MKIAGIVTEYNPFHNGHKYHIEEARKISGADYVIAVMSGDFVQRGAPAVIDKYSRAMMALKNGVDIVLELPVCYATGSAEYFALGAVSLLNRLGVVDYLVFGSECGDIALMEKAAALFSNPMDSFQKKLMSHMKEGMTYPAARVKTVEDYLGQYEEGQSRELARILAEPNNILGIEYLKALRRLNSPILPLTIARKTAHYHDRELTAPNQLLLSAYQFFPIPEAQSTKPVISSATAIRRVLQDSDNIFDLISVKDSVPEDVYEFLTRNYYKTCPISLEDFAGIIKYRLLMEDSRSLMQYVDITPDLADRLMNIRDFDTSMTGLIQNIKTKNLTFTRINRALIHLLLNIREASFRNYLQNGCTFYARVLGFRKEAAGVLRTITDKEKIPVITKVTKASEKLDDFGMTMLSGDIFAAHIYNQAVYEKYKTPILNEYKHGICIL